MEEVQVLQRPYFEVEYSDDDNITHFTQVKSIVDVNFLQDRFTNVKEKEIF